MLELLENTTGLVVGEHWLHLNRPNELSIDFLSYSKTSKQASHENYCVQRGVGSSFVVEKRHLITSIENENSDRICSVRLLSWNGAIINMYSVQCRYSIPALNAWAVGL